MNDDLWAGWEETLKQAVPKLVAAMRKDPNLIILLSRGELEAMSKQSQWGNFDRAEKQVQEWAKQSE